MGSREYRIVIPDAVREWTEDWLPVEGIKLVFNGDNVEIHLTDDLAFAKKAEQEPRIAAKPDEPINIRWR
jgi:hypothetical protein